MGEAEYESWLLGCDKDGNHHENASVTTTRAHWRDRYHVRDSNKILQYC